LRVGIYPLYNEFRIKLLQITYPSNQFINHLKSVTFFVFEPLQIMKSGILY